MKNTSRYGRDYYYYKDYERLYSNYDVSKLEIIKRLIEAGEREKLKVYMDSDGETFKRESK
ncbi:MAG: hypothetical protein ACPLSA_02170 [Caldanaerobacter sp.]|uniref:hypothetical protein n=1 Tax=Caldanaerobacter sp. TaxID=2930036 RepID=UPI003C75AEAE